MSTQLLRLEHQTSLNRYRTTLRDAFNTIEYVKADLNLGSDAKFLALHQPALEHAFIHLNTQLNNWPEIFTPGIFYQQSDLAKDIANVKKELSRVAAAMSPAQLEASMETLDLSLAPFELNGTLKILRTEGGYPFVLQTKQRIVELLQEYDSAAFISTDLYLRCAPILPRLIDFMGGAIDFYADAKKINPLGDDQRIATVRGTIDEMQGRQDGFMAATRDLSEGYSSLKDMFAAVVTDFGGVSSLTSIRRFLGVLESAAARLELAEEKTAHAKL